MNNPMINGHPKLSSSTWMLAVWLYLRSLGPIAHEVPASSLTGAAATGTGVTRGEALYDVYCTVCHGEKGTGGQLTAVALKDARRRGWMTPR